jgi:glycerophosphoryl diester phosphodiesterase
MRKRTISLIVLGFVLAVLGLINASIFAPLPKGDAKLISHRGVYHLYDKRAAYGRDTCTAQYIYLPQHEIFENSIASMESAVSLGASMVEVDIAPTKDGEMVLFHDWTVDCRTNGEGETRNLTLAELKALDIGYGYTADGGKGVGLIPTVEEALDALPDTPILFNFKSKNAQEADQLFQILQRSGRDSMNIGDAFYGGAKPVKRMQQLLPDNWSFSTKGRMKSCTIDYALYGWSGIVPESCVNGTIAIPINYRWAFWGYPNRLIARMESVGARVLIMGPHESGKSNEGLSSAKQIEQIPANYNGYIWVEDIMTVGPVFKNQN